MLSKVLSRRAKTGNVRVYLNVYDLTPMNGYTYWFGLGIYHSGVEVHGVEYAFGAHEYPTSGIFEVEPHKCPGFTFRRSIFIGTTDLGPREIRDFIEQLAGNYNGDTYHLIAKNCNHFCNDICVKLTGNSIPRWVNRLARIGLLCNCVLPVGLHVATVQHTPEFPLYGGEKKQVRSSFSRFSGSFATVRTRQRPLSVPSVFLSSPFKGGVLPWDLKGENMVK
eukprot:Gb_35129 [translate_table: standard]